MRLAEKNATMAIWLGKQYSLMSLRETMDSDFLDDLDDLFGPEENDDPPPKKAGSKPKERSEP